MTKLKDVLDLLWTEGTAVWATKVGNRKRAYLIDVFDKDDVTEYLDYPVAGIDVYNDGSVFISIGDKK